MRYLVTGATGFIGRQLCRQLSVSGAAVTGLSRHGGTLDDGSATIALDLSQATPDRDLLHNVDAVFHLAGIAHQKADPVAYQSLNHQATLRLAHQAKDAGVGCFIYLSSVKAMGPPFDSESRAEQDMVPPADAYGLSKRSAERDLLEAFSHSAMSLMIVRPALVYGPHVKGNLRQLAKGVRWRLPRPPQGGKRSMIALDDLVELLCMLAEHPPSQGHTWIACGDQDYSTRQIYDLLRRAHGMGQGASWMPPALWRAAARLVDVASGEQAGATYARLFGDETYSNAAVVAATAWRPQRRLEDDITQIAGVQGGGR